MESILRCGCKNGVASHTRLNRAVWVSGFAVATGLAALIRIPLPFTPVPVTLQTLVVMGSGLVLGRDALWAMALYLILGGIGLPLFAGSEAGFPYLLGPTGGYLIGFVAAAAVGGTWLHPMWDRLTPARRFLALFAVSFLVFLPGVLQLALVGRLSLVQALLLGFLPFLPGDLLKCAVLSGLPARWRR